MDWLRTITKKDWVLLAAGIAAVVVALIFFAPGRAGKAPADGVPRVPAAQGAAKADAAGLLRQAEEKYAQGRRAYEAGDEAGARKLCKEAAQLYRRYLEAIPGDLRAITAMAGAALYAGEIDAAREAYRQALEEGQKWLAGAHVGYAVLLADYDRDYEAAAEHLREAAGLDSQGEVGKKAREMLEEMEIK